MKKKLIVLLAAMMLAASGCSDSSASGNLNDIINPGDLSGVTTSETNDSSAVSTVTSTEQGDYLLPSGEKGEALFSSSSKIELVENKVKIKIRKVYEQGGMLVVKIEALSGYNKTITSISDLNFKITDKNDNLVAEHTFDRLRDENGKTVKLRPEQTVDAMLVYPSGTYTTKGIDFSHLYWNFEYKKNYDDSSTPQETSGTTVSIPSAVHLPSGEKGEILFNGTGKIKETKDNLDFEIRSVYCQGDDLVVIADVRNGFSSELQRVYSVDFEIRDKNRVSIAKNSFYELRDAQGKRVTLKPSEVKQVMFVYPKSAYNIASADFDHLYWSYHFSYRKNKS